MMGFDSRANYALGLPRSQTSTGSLLCTDSPSNPTFLSNVHHTIYVTWWRWWDSNPWPPACRAGALPAELHPHIKCSMHNWVLLFSFCFGLRKEEYFFLSFRSVGIELSSRTVSRKVFSPLQSLTSVFGMGTGGPSAFVTLTFLSVNLIHWKLNNTSFERCLFIL